MLKIIFVALCAIFTVTTAMVVITSDMDPPPLLGANRCTWGPSYWCQNLTFSAGCNATKHCIDRVWPNETVKEDNDDVCTICKDMIQQAKNQLKSNQTQEELKAVFEGSCKLIIVELIVEECIKLVDQFIPELVETLASQMNPSIVCSVSGLCNSQHFDQLLLEHKKLKEQNLKKNVISLKNDELQPDECSKCFTIATRIEEKFKETSRDHLFTEFLVLCRNTGSQSDACANIVTKYFNTIYNYLKKNLSARHICFLSGQCSKLFHKHEGSNDKVPDVEIRPLSSVGMVEIGDDLPCKLCEQLVGHLRDLLVANTTEEEFKRILNGICGEMEGFSNQCDSIVDEYYAEIYSYLVHHLDGNAVCIMGGICPSPQTQQSDVPIIPLLSSKATEIGVRILNEKKTYKHHNLGENGAGIKKINTMNSAEKMQLPIERFGNPLSILIFPNMDVEGQETCVFCEYFLHELQHFLTDPKVEDEVKASVDKMCKKLPDFLKDMCDQFVKTYGNAIVAILVQEIDPSMVCPMVRVCPTQQHMEAFQKLDKKWMIQSDVKSKPSCPLCLFAVTQIYNVIKDNKTEENIVKELDKLCIHLPKDVTEQCIYFVKAYSKELVQMLISDLTPQEVCVYMKLCNEAKKIAPSIFIPVDKDNEIMSNEIPKDEIVSMESVENAKENTECFLCEQVVKFVEDILQNNNTENEVKKVIHGACKYWPTNIKIKCTKFVETYADNIIDWLSHDVHPKLICILLEACQDQNMHNFEQSVAECALFQNIMPKIYSELIFPVDEKKIIKVVSQACSYVQACKQSQCNTMIKIYGQSFINLLKERKSMEEMYSEMALCAPSDYIALSRGMLKECNTKNTLFSSSTINADANHR